MIPNEDDFTIVKIILKQTAWIWL